MNIAEAPDLDVLLLPGGYGYQKWFAPIKYGAKPVIKAARSQCAASAYGCDVLRPAPQK